MKKPTRADYNRYLQSEHWQGFRQSYRDSQEMPQHCTACDDSQFVLHHISYKNLHRETFADVIPLCFKCHDALHKYQQTNRLSNSRPDIALKRMMGWSTAETERRFQAFKKLWTLPQEKPVTRKTRTKKIPRCSTDYTKLAKDLTNFRRYIAAGYSNAELARMYKVDVAYVAGYISKYSEYFT